jgi:hypothetical protein
MSDLNITWPSGGDVKAYEGCNNGGTIQARAAHAKYGLSWETLCKHSVPCFRHGGGYGNSDLYHYLAEDDCKALKEKLEEIADSKLKEELGDKAFKEHKAALDRQRHKEEVFERTKAMEQNATAALRSHLPTCLEVLGTLETLGDNLPPAPSAEEAIVKAVAKRVFALTDKDIVGVKTVQSGKKVLYNVNECMQIAIGKHDPTKMKYSAHGSTKPLSDLTPVLLAKQQQDFGKYYGGSLLSRLRASATGCTPGMVAEVANGAMFNLETKAARLRAELAAAERSLNIARKVRDELEASAAVEEGDLEKMAEERISKRQKIADQ